MTGERRGPRPLPLHLGLAGLRTMLALTPPSPVSPSGWTGWNGDWPRSKPDQAEHVRIAAALARSAHRPEAFQAAVWQHLVAENAALLAGVRAYRHAPAPPTPPPVPVVWTEGGSRMLDYGGAGPTLLVVPSLVNRARVLDLLPEPSLLRWLAASGVRPLLLDWGEPGALERGFGLDDYIAGRLARALAHAAAAGPVLLAGYCMGGLLALPAALAAPERVRGLALLATPWDFHAGDAGGALALAASLPLLEPMLAATGTMPVDALQACFALLDPYGVAGKFRAFAALPAESAAARRFVALEDWLNDGVPLAAPVAREALSGWYGANVTARGAWRVGGAPVDPAELRCPALVVVPQRDRVVPPATARPLHAALPNAVLREAAAGHVGMVAGTAAEAVLWRPLRDWALAC